MLLLTLIFVFRQSPLTILSVADLVSSQPFSAWPTLSSEFPEYNHLQYLFVRVQHLLEYLLHDLVGQFHQVISRLLDQAAEAVPHDGIALWIESVSQHG